MKVLALNAGSSSLKFAVVETSGVDLARAAGQGGAAGTRWLVGGAVRDLGEKPTFSVEEPGSPSVTSRARSLDVGGAVQLVLEWLTHQPEPGVGSWLRQVEALGHRVVHGGSEFFSPAVLDTRTLDALERLEELAPLHNAAALAAIRAARAYVGESLPAVAVFDSAFFHDLPAHAATYGLPWDLARRHGIRRFGFHGISHAYLSQRYAELMGPPSEKAAIVTLHLGSGCSAAAIRHGRPIDVSMGFTPLEGLMMATRAGDLDPAIVAFVARKERVDADTVEEWLNRKSGLLGVSGVSGEIREVLRRARAGDARCRLAAEVFCYRARKYVGAYLAALGGADALVFAGGIGENLPEVRQRICAEMDWCGLTLDHARNGAAIGSEAKISADASTTAVYVIPTREELWIGCEVARRLGQS